MKHLFLNWQRWAIREEGTMYKIFGWRGIAIELLSQRILFGLEWNWEMRGMALFLGIIRIQVCFPSETFLDRVRDQIMAEEERRA